MDRYGDTGSGVPLMRLVAWDTKRDNGPGRWSNSYQPHARSRKAIAACSRIAGSPFGFANHGKLWNDSPFMTVALVLFAMVLIGVTSRDTSESGHCDFYLLDGLSSASGCVAGGNYILSASVRAASSEARDEVDSLACSVCALDAGFRSGSARPLTGSEMDAVYAAIDLLRDDDQYRAIGDALMEHTHLLQAQQMSRHTRGRTPFFTQGGFVLNERLTHRVVETPDSQCAVAELAGTLVHEYLHTQQLGADRGPVEQALHQFAYGFMYAVSLPFELSGIGLRDQNGQGHGLVEIGPWRAGNDAQGRIFEALQTRTLNSRDAKIALRKVSDASGGVG